MSGNTEPSPVHPLVYDQITASHIRSATLRTKVAAGPSVLDAYCWRRICTSFKAASNDICHSLAVLAKRLCTTLVDPKGISPLLACRLIALDKCPGIRPIGICETHMRIIAKAVLLTTKDDLLDAVGPRQLCTGQIARIEAASYQNTETILLINATIAFKSLNWLVALRNIQHCCPTLPNTYRKPSELFVDGQVLRSEEGTTQSDPLAMPMYALATISLIN